jgi:L-lactate dehydrogenase complex protein LldG
MTAKNEILGSIRKHLTASAPFDAQHEARHGGHEIVEKLVSVSVTLDRDSLVAMFRENLEAVGGKVSVVNDITEASAIISGIVGTEKKVAVSDDSIVQQLGEGIADHADVFTNVSGAELFDFDFGITGAQWGIAETGTLVLESGKERNRLASLVPPVHIAVIEAKNIRQRMSEVLTLVSESELSRAVTFITGPSRTSDIELTLAIGVHGPAELHVILIDNK